MLGKLIKYEFKHTSKTMFTTFVVLAFATLMGSIALYQVDRGTGDKGTFRDHQRGHACPLFYRHYRYLLRRFYLSLLSLP